MDSDNALIALSALSQETRLQVFRLLIEYGLEGAPAGVIGEQLGIPHNKLSFHLSHLSHAGLVSSHRKGRSIIYAANCDNVKALIDYLLDNCCIRDDASDCFPTCATPKKKKKKK